MTRGLSGAQLTAAAAPTRSIVPLVEMFFQSGTLRLARSQWNIINGPDTYVAASIEIKQLRESSGSTEGAEFTMSGLDPAIIAIAHQEPYRGKIIRLLKAYVNPDTNQLIGAPVPRFIGRIKAIPTTENNSTCDVTVVAEHYEAELTRAAPLRLNNVDQTRFYPGDRGCEYAEQVVEKNVIWPTKEAMEK